ncbi:hypothetical protein [Priestia flexa]|uniref:hypothetical protein n=1 Tax=Priestia flexa TaxID=86664 RepID=UPI001B32629A|nr:hypothetical protein [Priestia flexa]
MKFNYSLKGYGWAKALIEVDATKLEFTPSYLTDAFGDLLRSFVSLLIDEEEEVTVLWNEEPDEIEWMFVRKNGNELSIQITLYEENYETGKAKGKVLLNTECLFINFVHEVINQADQLLSTNGILGYRNIWEMHEFPISSYLQLKDFLQNGSITIEKKVDSQRVNYNDEQSDLQKELRFLNSLMKK